MGESVDEAVVKALCERLARTPQRTARGRSGELLEIGGMRCPHDYDLRSPNEILGI